MDISPVSTNAAMAAIVNHLQGISEAQTVVMKQIADGEKQMAAMLQEMGIGQNIDVQA